MFPPIRKLRGDDPVDHFDCGQQDLNSYLRLHAWNNQKANAAQTYVALSGGSLAGYYSICATGVSYADAPERVKKGLARHTVPAMLLARWAVDTQFRGQGFGLALLKDALLNTLKVADIVGVRALVAQAKDEDGARRYLRHGFQSSATIPNQLFLLLKDVQRTLA